MSQTLALAEIKRFLSNPNPEVLSISGRWGVGKTYAWDETLKEMRSTTTLRSYAYVSAFGLRTLDSLKTAIVQSTVSLDGKELEPTVDSFLDHLTSVAGARKLLGEGTRKSFALWSKGVSTLPYVGKLADLLAPGAALLIRKQIVCIDDIERAGDGLNVADILGLVSSLRERKGCKVVLLLNEDNLGDQGLKYREYLEKVVDQAIKFRPTAKESAEAALDATDRLTPSLSAKTVSLGIINIRVIRRIRRFFSHVEPLLAGLHEGVTEAVISSIVLLGWCVFEPQLAPELERVRRFNQFAGFFGEDQRSLEDKKTDLIIQEYGFQNFEALDALLLAGLQSGAFDNAMLVSELSKIDARLRKEDVQVAIGRPWSIFSDSLDDNIDEFIAALVAVIEKYGKDMAPSDATSALSFLREFDRQEEADRLLQVYVAAQEGKPREYFAAQHDRYSSPLDAGIAAAFERRLKAMPLNRDPGVVLLDIASKDGWNPIDIEFLASVPVEEYRALVKRLRGAELQAVIVAALRFDEIHGVGTHERDVSQRMQEALQLVAAENALNGMRLKPYLKATPAPDAGA